MKKGILWGVTGAVVVIGTVMYIGYSIMGGALEDWFVVGVLAFTDVFMFVVLITIVTKVLPSLRSASSVFLDLGRMPNKHLALYVIFALSISILGLFGLFGPSLHQDESILHSPFAISLLVIFLAIVAANIVFVATGRRQIREDGFRNYGYLYKWDEIESYRWKDGTGTTLVIGWIGSADRGVKTSSPVKFLGSAVNWDGSINIPIPAEQKESVDKLFQKFCGSEKKIEEIET